jgi:NADPH2:quinone reductase
MKAWQVTELGRPDQILHLGEMATPVAGTNQIVVKVRACSLGFPDVLMCRGEYQVKPAFPFVPGAELCGEVVDANGHPRFALGDRVLGLASGFLGGLAEHATMDATLAFPAPKQLEDAEAASLFSAYQTGWFGLHRRAALQPGETLVVHAAAGGVGTAAVQLGLAAGARVVAIVRGEHKADLARRLGADLVIDRTVTPVAATVNEFTGGRGADVICDPVGGDSYLDSTKCIAFEGRIVLIGFAGGEIQTQRLNHPLIKNYSIVGLHLAMYTMREPALVRSVHDELSRLVASNEIRPQVGRRSPFESAADALQELADGRSTGRNVVVGAN